jgi:DNA-binding LacI/PurR family transcriptional regulator
MGRLAARLLVDEIADPSGHVHQKAILEPTLVQRESSRRPAGA